MQFQLIPGFFIFLGSYLPLAIILAVQDIPFSWWSKPFCNFSQLGTKSCSYNPFEHPAISIAFILVAFVAVILSSISLQRISYPFNIDIKRAKTIPNEIINYTFPYVVSFMGITYGDPQKIIGFAVFLFWMFSITYKSGQLLMNPLLLIFGWRLYEATIVINNVEKDVRVLKRGSLILGTARSQTIQDFYIINN